MGRDGKSLGRISSLSMSSMAHLALSTLRTNERTLVNPLVKLSVIPTSESSTLHLLAVTQAGQFGDCITVACSRCFIVWCKKKLCITYM